MQREWFVFYASFLSAIEYLPEVNQLKAYQYLTSYALKGIEPQQWEDGIAYAIYLMAKPQIDKNNERFVNWRKWWAPLWNSNAVKDWQIDIKQPKTTKVQPTNEKKQPKEKDKVKDKVKEKEKENVKEKEKKEKYKDFVFLSPSEFQKLKELLGEWNLENYIEALNNYLGQKGKNIYKSHYFAIRNWRNRDIKDWKLKKQSQKSENYSTENRALDV